MNLGIDFGTTNSSLSFQQNPRRGPECARVDSYATLPYDTILRTAALLDQSGQVLPDGVGAQALDPINWTDRRSGAPRRVLQRIKPFLRTFSLREVWPVQRTRIDVNLYDHLRQEPGTVTIRELVESGDINCSRDELMAAGAEIFRRLFSAVPDEVRRATDRYVIGVPLTFPDYAKKRLIDIVVRSGAIDSEQPYQEAIRRIRFLPEPVGASLLYGHEYELPRGRSRGRLLVFDSGGGTLDLALMEIERIDDELRPTRQLRLAATELAGRRFDECIEANALSSYREDVVRWQASARDADEVARYYLEEAAEDIKIELSTKDEHQTVRLAPAGIMPTVTRRDFERWCAPVLDETSRFVRDSIADRDEVDVVLMVGGSSLIPCVQRRVQELFPHAQIIAENPDSTERGGGVERAMTAVSRGLALYDETIGRHSVTPFAYGFWEPSTNRVHAAAEKWTTHTTDRPVVKLAAAPKSSAVTLTLVQELVTSERVLNLLNVPVSVGAAEVRVRISTSDGTLYPVIQRLDQKGNVLDAFDAAELPEASVRRLVENEDHAIRWSGGSPGAGDTPYPEVVPLRTGDRVRFRPDGAVREQYGTITRIKRIADGLPYAEIAQWDLSRYVFTIAGENGGEYRHWPRNAADVILDRRGNSNRRRRSPAAIG